MPYHEDYQERWQRWTDAQAYAASDGVGELFDSWDEWKRQRKENRKRETEEFWAHPHPWLRGFMYLGIGLALGVIAQQ